MSHPGCSPGPARRLEGVLSPVIPQLTELIRQSPGCLSLAQGMVDWAPPEGVRQALSEALADPAADLDRYGPMAGDDELLVAIRQELTSHHQLDLQGSALLVTAGSNMAFLALVQVLCDPGDEVILPVPWYFNHVMAVQLAGGVPISVPMAGEGGLIPDPDQLAAAITPRSRAIVTVSPGNPSGLVTPPERLEAINRLCAHHGLIHISDEAYAAFVHGPVPHRSPGALAGSGGHTVSLYSLSKAYGMAGWRLGYGAIPAQLLPALVKVQDTNLICPPRPMQRAAGAALAAGPQWCRPRVASLEPRRQALVAATASAAANGLDVRLLAPPDGAFYGLLEVPCPHSEDTLITSLIRNHGVAVVPGQSFGLVSPPGRAVLRVSYGMQPPDLLGQALRRLFKGLAAQG